MKWLIVLALLALPAPNSALAAGVQAWARQSPLESRLSSMALAGGSISGGGLGLLRHDQLLLLDLLYPGPFHPKREAAPSREAVLYYWAHKSLTVDFYWRNQPSLRLDSLPAWKDSEFVNTQASYGYTCACLNMEIDTRSKKVLRVLGGKQRLLKNCLEDHSLPAPYGKECR